MILCGDRAGNYGKGEGKGVGCPYRRTSSGGKKMWSGTKKYSNVKISDRA